MEKNTNASYNLNLFYMTKLELNLIECNTWSLTWRKNIANVKPALRSDSGADVLHEEPAIRHLKVTCGTCYLAWPWDSQTPPVSLPTDFHPLDLIVIPIGRDYHRGDHTRHQHHFKSGHLPSQSEWLLCPKPHVDVLGWIPHIPQPVKRSSAGRPQLGAWDSSVSPLRFVLVRAVGDPPTQNKCTCHLRYMWPLPPCVPLSAAGFCFSKQCSSHADANFSLIMGVTTKQLCVSHWLWLSLRVMERTYIACNFKDFSSANVKRHVTFLTCSS